MKQIKRILILCLTLTILLNLTACGDPTIEMNLNDYYSIEVDGIDGEAVVSVVGQREMKEDFMQKMGGNVTDTQIKTFISCIDVRIDKQFNVSNGDKVTLSFATDEDLEKSFNIKVKYEPIVLIVEGLPEKEYEEYNPFEELHVSFTRLEGASSDVDIKIGASGNTYLGGQYEIIIPNRSPEYMGEGDMTHFYSEHLQNGDKIIVNYTYDAKTAENYAKRVVETTKEYIVQIEK